jgi:hypothetical protein
MMSSDNFPLLHLGHTATPAPQTRCLWTAWSSRLHLPLVWLPATLVFPSTPRDAYTGTTQQVAFTKGWHSAWQDWIPGKARAGSPENLMAVACPTQVLSTFAPSSCPTTSTDPGEQGVLPSRSPRSNGMGGGCVKGHKILKLLALVGWLHPEPQ